MTQHHDRKARIRARMAATGETYTAAARHIDAHRHPRPDLAILGGLPYAAGRPVDLPLASTAVGACRAGCRHCQDDAVAALAADCAIIAVLAGAVYGMLPVAGALASPATRIWQPLAQQAMASGDGVQALAAIEAMTAQDREALVQDALDHWAAGGLPADAIHIVQLDHDDAADRGPDETAPIYALSPGTVTTPQGPLPMVLLIPETPGAGLSDLRAVRLAGLGHDETAGCRSVLADAHGHRHPLHRRDRPHRRRGLGWLSPRTVGT
ncbi:hypothetical protein DI270_017330 [Microbispora triticiradicis]|uniref:Uncharacterized protein n=1 Tax=Microbispora triticiradicis TaxID=2200763 RepID=A0ABX9LI67_9ACTN|nr:hypothetical protein [Microbispora triticiradicis]RGA03654.1 hypothetical protein DI270_017330 [Microbispora triticiradicis]GLW22934.1 hypothetical protein Mame01_29770 [Microbispora amethystogenes]